MASYFWVGGSGTWDAVTTTNWALSSGGAGGAGVPTGSDSATFDANSGTGTVTTGTGATGSTVVFNSPGISVVLGADLTTTAGFFFTQGTLDIGNFNASFDNFSCSTTAARTISVGTGQFFLTGQNATVLNINITTNLTYSGRVTYNLSGSPSSGTRLAQHGFVAESFMPQINVLSGSDAITLNGFWFDVDFTGFSGTLNNNGRNIYGSLVLSPTMTLAAGTGKTDFRGGATGKTITTNGRLLDFPVEFVAGGASWIFQDDFTQGATRAFIHNAGTIDANGNDITVGTFASSSTSARTITIGSGTWTVQGDGATAWNTTTTNLTVTASTGTISMTSANAKTFVGSGKTWPTLNQGGAGALTIAGSNTFSNITNTVQPATITLTSGATQTVDDFGVSGTAGNLITLNASTPGAQATLSDSIGTNSVSFVSIQDIDATGGATWEAFISNGNIDAGNNVGWSFLPAVKKVFRKIFNPIFNPIFKPVF